MDSHALSEAPAEGDGRRLPADALAAIVALVRERRGIDLRDRRTEPLERAVAGRVVATGAKGAAAYVDRLREDPAEVGRLAAAALVGATSFFRDPPVFEALERAVLPALFARAGRDGEVRAWTVGTATGEEAYTVAMLLAEARAALATVDPGCCGFSVLATDVDEGALDVARAGRYPADGAGTVPARLRGRWLGPAVAGRVEVAPELRSRVTFARHDVVGPRLAPREAVIAGFDLVLCRNVLIYFDGRLARNALDRLAAVLRPGGALVLGPADAPGAGPGPAFEPWPGPVREAPIYRRREEA